MSSLYEQHIMEHYRSPRKRCTLSHADASIHDTNPLCGDEITVQLLITDGRISKACHQARGCAVSQAGASLLFERLEGMTIPAVIAFSKEELLNEFGTELSVSRIKCALLGLSAVKKALVTYEDTYARH